MRRRRFWIAFVIVLFGLLLSMSGITCLLIQSVQGKTEEETVAYMQEIAWQINGSLQDKLEGDLYLLQNAAQFLSKAPTLLELSLNEAFSDLTAKNRFTALTLVQTDGILSESSNGEDHDIREQAYFQRALHGETVLQYTREPPAGSEDRALIFAVPVWQQGQVKAVLIGQYGVDVLDQLLSADYFRQKGYSCIVKQTGEIIAGVQDNSMTYVQDFAIRGRYHLTKEGVEELINSMAQAERGTIPCSRGHSNFLMYYEPMQVNDWYLLMALPQAALTEKADAVIVTVSLYTGAILVLFILVVGTAFFLVLRQSNQMRKAYQRVDSIYRTVPGALAQFQRDAPGNVKMANDAFYQLIGCASGKTEMQHNCPLQKLVDEETWDTICLLPSGISELEFPLLCVDGQVKWVFGRFDCDVATTLVQCAMTDMSYQRKRLRTAQEQARTDSLTGLKNKFAAHTDVDQMLLQSPIEGVLLLFDLDHFKQVNDTLGHPAGDTLLQQFGRYLQQGFRTDDFIARLGGDEFLVFLQNGITEEHVKEKVTVLLQQLQQALKEYCPGLPCSASVGIAFASAECRTFDTLYACADKALYEAKRKGKDGFAIYQEGLDPCWRYDVRKDS